MFTLKLWCKRICSSIHTLESTYSLNGNPQREFSSEDGFHVTGLNTSRGDRLRDMSHRGDFITLAGDEVLQEAGGFSLLGREALERLESWCQGRQGFHDHHCV